MFNFNIYKILISQLGSFEPAELKVHNIIRRFGGKTKICKSITSVILDMQVERTSSVFISPFVGGAPVELSIIANDSMGFKKFIWNDGDKRLTCMIQQMLKNENFSSLVVEKLNLDTNMRKVYESCQTETSNEAENAVNYYITVMFSYGATTTTGFRFNDSFQANVERANIIKSISNHCEEVGSIAGEVYKDGKLQIFSDILGTSWKQLETFINNDCLIYCDPPYRELEKYEVKLNIAEFLTKVVNITKEYPDIRIVISEYRNDTYNETLISNGFEVIEIGTLKNQAGNLRTEVLYIYKGGAG